MRDTIWFVLPLLLSRIGGFFAFFSIFQKYREKLAWNTMFQAVWIAYKTALFHIYQTLLLRFFIETKMCILSSNDITLLFQFRRTGIEPVISDPVSSTDKRFIH